MVPAVTFTFAVLLLASIARADLQLTPKATEYDLDGVKFKHLVFSDDGRQVTYTPPRGWQYLGTADRLVLHPESGSSAEAVISRVKLAQSEVFDDATMKRLSEEVIASVPSTATHVTMVAQQKNPLLIEKKETFLVVISYDCYGNPYARSVMFVNRKNEQLRFQLTAPQWNFSRAQKEFFSSHFSWQNL
jgi:hypothetical protein